MQPSITSSSRSAVYNSGIDVYAVHFVDGTRDRIFRVLQQFRMEAERACCTILILAERRDLLDVDVSIVLKAYAIVSRSIQQRFMLHIRKVGSILGGGGVGHGEKSGTITIRGRIHQ